jgi:hypothetical protein
VFRAGLGKLDHLHSSTLSLLEELLARLFSFFFWQL